MKPSLASSPMTGRVYFVSRWKAPGVAGTKHDVTEQLAGIGYVPLDEELKSLLEEVAFNTEETCGDLPDRQACIRCRAEALIDRYAANPQAQRMAVKVEGDK